MFFNMTLFLYTIMTYLCIYYNEKKSVKNV